MGRVQGKVAIVTGAASNPGLGRSTALTLAREGARLVVTDVDLPGAEDCARAIRDAGGEAIVFQQDVTQEDVWQRVVNETVAHFGRLDVLVNNAGIAVLKTIDNMTLADWNRQIDVNLTSVFLGCKYGMAAMRNNGGGSIINLSSVAGLSAWRPAAPTGPRRAACASCRSRSRSRARRRISVATPCTRA